MSSFKKSPNDGLKRACKPIGDQAGAVIYGADVAFAPFAGLNNHIANDFGCIGERVIRQVGIALSRACVCPSKP